MKNLKKVLALVLALACAFTMFAGATFTDQADIAVDDDVVDTLVSLGVIQGYSDGSFRPNDTVTRAEMAKMIYVLRTGNSDASAYNDDATTFTDIGSHWARGYIKYCQSLGIIAGKSSTTFAPDSLVTAQEAAKMLLVTLGYDAEKAGLVGPNWAAKTNALADENGLLEDVNTSFTSACPRQYAAQLIYNTLDTPTVIWRDDAYTNETLLGDDNKTVGEKYMGLHSVEGILTSFSKEDGKDTYGASVTDVTKKDGTKGDYSDVDFTKIATDYGTLKNQKVKVLYKDTDEVYGIFAITDSNKVVSGLLGDFGKDGEKIKYSGTKYTVADKSSVLIDDEAVETGLTAKELAEYVDGVSGLAKAYDASAISNSDNNKINLLDIKAFAIAQVTYVGSDYINVSYKNGSNASLKFDSKLKDEDATYPSDIAKDDYVAVTAAVNTSEDKIGVTKLDLVEGKITATKNSTSSDSYKVTIDGVTYEMAGISSSDASDLTLNSTVSLVVKGKYVVLVDDADAGAKDIALLEELYKSGNKWYATLLKDDGSEETVSLKKNEEINGGSTTPVEFDGATTAGGDSIVLVTYTKSSNDYKLKVLGDGTDAGYDVIEETSGNYVDNNRLQKSTQVKAINDDAVVFVRYKTDSFKVITGKTLKNWKDSSKFDSIVAADASNSVNYAKVIYADLGDSNIKGGSDVNYGYVFESTTGTDADETEYHVYQIWNGEETIEVWTEDSDSVVRGNVIKYSLDGEVEGHTEISIDNVYSLSEAAGIGVVVNGDYDSDLNGTAYFASTNGKTTIAKDGLTTTGIDFDEDDDSIILFADTSDDDADGDGVVSSTVTDLTDYVREDGDNYVANAIYWTDGDAYIMVIDIDSELKASVFGLN